LAADFVEQDIINMGIVSRLFSHVNSGISTKDYYSSMNQALARLNDEYTMLHYPYFISEADSFLEAQTNLTDYCMSLLPSLEKKVVLEIGCGNGVQALYINRNYNPGHIKAIDLNHGNIEIARKEAEKEGIDNIIFHVDDAHDLLTIEDNSVDVVINIESAFHYPDKPSFLRQVHRVLKPGGTILIADILTTRKRSNQLKDRWKKKMSYHHWPESSYREELPQANIHLHSFNDITAHVIQGFRCYKKWFRDMERRHLLEDLIMKLYYSIHVQINMYLLRTSRQYCVMVGRKPQLPGIPRT
jgi:ubiquinone/menaquinone biosynthesis C-methylase UbiE